MKSAELGESRAQMSRVSDKWPRYSTKGNISSDTNLCWTLERIPIDGDGVVWDFFYQSDQADGVFRVWKEREKGDKWKEISSRKLKALFGWRLSGASDHRQSDVN